MDRGLVEQFERCRSIGTRERLAFSILLYNGLRRGDAARLGRQHVSNGMIYMRAEKIDAQMTIPVLPELQRILDASRTGALTFVATEQGTAMAKESFGNRVRRTYKAAGVPGSAHGLRKLLRPDLPTLTSPRPSSTRLWGGRPGAAGRASTRAAETPRSSAQRAVDKLQKNELATSYAHPD